MSGKKNKAFFYRITAAEFMAEVFQIPDGKHEEWLRNFAIALVSGVPNSDYSAQIIAEVEEYRTAASIKGMKGAQARWEKMAEA